MKRIKASDKQCIECKEQAVAFFPAIDPDIPSYPYCRKCLDKAKMSLLIKLGEISLTSFNFNFFLP